MTKYKCNYCGEISSEEDWDRETKEEYPLTSEIGSVSLDIDWIFICPNCKKENKIKNIEEIENEDELPNKFCFIISLHIDENGFIEGKIYKAVKDGNYYDVIFTDSGENVTSVRYRGDEVEQYIKEDIWIMIDEDFDFGEKNKKDNLKKGDKFKLPNNTVAEILAVEYDEYYDRKEYYCRIIKGSRKGSTIIITVDEVGKIIDDKESKKNHEDDFCEDW